MSDSDDQTASAGKMSLHELRLINVGLRCIKGNAGIDINKFTKMAGYKSNSVASTTWSRVKRHLQKVVPVEEPDDSDHEEGPKGGANKRKRSAKKVDDSSGDEAGPSNKQARGKKAQRDESGGEVVDEPNTKKAQKDESGDDIANDPNTKKARVKKVAKADDTDEGAAVGQAGSSSQSAAKDGVTPDNDESSTADCITVKGSDEGAGPSTKKGGKKAQKGKARAEPGNDDGDEVSIDREKSKKGPVPNDGKGKNDDASNEDAPAIKAGKKKTVAVKKGKGKAVQDSEGSDDADDGKTKDSAKVSKNKALVAGKGARQTKIVKKAPVKALKKGKECPDGA